MTKIPRRFSFIKYKKQRFEYKDIKIPSPEFSLYDTPETFYCENTKLIEDEAIVQLIDDVPYVIGRCFDNTENLFNKFQENNLKIQPYVGWLFIGDVLPTLHCWAVYKAKYLIDLSADDIFMQPINLGAKSEEEKRKYVADLLKSRLELKNSERCCLGNALICHYYIGSKCTIRQAKDFYSKLMIKYPNHRSLVKGTNASGRSPLQQLIDQKKRRVNVFFLFSKMEFILKFPTLVLYVYNINRQSRNLF